MSEHRTPNAFGALTSQVRAVARLWARLPRQRVLGLLALVVLQLLYFPINRSVRGGVILTTSWDVYVPFWPLWAVPYLLSIVWWQVCLFWAAFRMDDTRWRALLIAFTVTMLTSYVVYILYPTYVRRPVVEGHTWPAELVRTIYENDRLYNAFPSGHAYITILIFFFWWDWQPRLRWLWAVIAVTVILSTLFTGQHHLLDPLGGILWGWIGYRFGTWATRRALKA
jgi:membrane-associated phospholipid phosphatase